MLICYKCAIERGGKAGKGATTARYTKCPFCLEFTTCKPDYKYGLELKEPKPETAPEAKPMLKRYGDKVFFNE